MARVQRRNVILDVDDAQVEYYVGIGYDVIDASGKVLKATVPQDIATLQKAYRDHISEIAGLKTKISDLEATLKKFVQEDEKPSRKKASVKTDN